MRSLQVKLLVAFLAVALVAVGVLGLLVGRATSGAFGDYLAGHQHAPTAAMGRMMDEMMGSATSRAMMDQMLGAPERAYLASVEGTLWLAGGFAVLTAVGLSLLLARQIAAPARAVTQAARRLAAGDLAQRVPVRSADELGELAAAFNTLATALSHQEALRRQMAADIAHELRTPLAVIQANLEAMLDGVRPLSREAVADLHQETQLLARLVSDLRDLSLAEAGQLPLRREPTDLAALAQATCARFAQQAQARKVQIAVEAADALPAADLDPDRVGQALGNLLDNALRHTPPGGSVTVRVEPGVQPGTVQVRVSDSGGGIPAEHLTNVFERFYRVDRARSRAAGGSGIGLAVVKQLVEAHGGRAWVESPPGQGATFGLLFPVVVGGS
ncbi:MAG: HAMP domain-containing protein [Chloroflexi bacterium]|nr:HAMP domain-containing protein [Chloroflexota bacterium]